MLLYYHIDSNMTHDMKRITIRISEAEHEILTRFCSLTERTQNDVLRECIRGFAMQISPSASALIHKGKQGDIPTYGRG